MGQGVLYFLLLLIFLILGVSFVSVRLIQVAREYFFRRETQQLKKLFMQDQRILDVGSGKGIFADTISCLIPASVVCSDIQNRHRGNAPFALANGNSLPFPDKSFDTVTMFYVLHHTDTPRDLLIEARRVSCNKILIHENVYENRLEKFALVLHVYGFQCFFHLSGASVRTDKQWQALFAELGLIVKHKRLILKKLRYPVTYYEYLLEIV